MEWELSYRDRLMHAFDKVLELAERNGIFLKLVLSDKNDHIYKKLDDDGSFVIGSETDTLTNIEKAELTGGTSANTIHPKVMGNGGRTQIPPIPKNPSQYVSVGSSVTTILQNLSNMGPLGPNSQ